MQEGRDEGNGVVGYNFCKKLIEVELVSREPPKRHVVGQALKPGWTSES